jgi:hypothetical protein
MKSSPWNYITNITHIHIKKSMHINEGVSVTITHVKENRKTGGEVFCGHDVKKFSSLLENLNDSSLYNLQICPT